MACAPTSYNLVMLRSRELTTVPSLAVFSIMMDEREKDLAYRLLVALRCFRVLSITKNEEETT